MARTARNKATPDDFWAKVAAKSPDDCWIWPMSKNAGGYGVTSWNRTRMLTHRLAYQLANNVVLPRQVPSKTCQVVMHSCDNRACCNPAHLSLGTYLTNRRDCIAKGRHNCPSGDRNGSRLKPERLKRGDENPSRTQPEKLKRGTEHHKAQLTEAQVLEIRRRSEAGEGNVVIGKDYGINGALVWKIKTRHIWRHI